MYGRIKEMEKFHSIVITAGGVAVPNATVTVYDSGTTNLRSIYSDEGTSVKDNPFTTDDYGRFSFYAADGDIDIKVSGSSISTYTLSDVSICDAHQIIDAGDIILKSGKKIYLNVEKTIYLISANGTTFDFYIAGIKKGEISSSGFRAI